MAGLRMSWDCCNCNSSGKVEDTTNIVGACPICFHHHGEVRYYCDMDIREFLEVLSDMSETELVKNSNAIQECALDLLDKL